MKNWLVLIFLPFAEAIILDDVLMHVYNDGV